MLSSVYVVSISTDTTQAFMDGEVIISISESMLLPDMNLEMLEQMSTNES